MEVDYWLLELMTDEEYALPLLVLQSANIALTLLFLLLFSRRAHTLRSFSRTPRFQNYFPKLRIFLCLSYVAMSLALLTVSLLWGGEAQWYEKVLAGGGGECVNSVMLLVQLGVLRLELNRQQPYTSAHVFYFLYVAVLSLIRLGLALAAFLSTNRNPASLVLSALIAVDSCAQLAYWAVKKQSLPQFQRPTARDIAPFRFGLAPSRPRPESSHISNCASSQDIFPYITPTVTIQNGKIRIVLERPSLRLDQRSKPQNRQESTLLAALSARPASDCVQELLSVGLYSLSDIQRFYVDCGRFPLTRKLRFQNIALPELVRSLQAYLAELLSEKKRYQPSVLRFLRVEGEAAQIYRLWQSQWESEVEGEAGEDDSNAIYCSVLLYRHLWVTDHFQFYLKTTPHAHPPAYAAKRYSNFEDLHLALRHSIKTMGRTLELPPLPRKQLFHWNEDEQISQRRADLEGYLQMLANDYTLMEVPALREKIAEFMGVEVGVPRFPLQFYPHLKIVKASISKTLIGADYVTHYHFTLFRTAIPTSSLTVRFSQLEQLHHELQRWMGNTQVTYKALVLPEKVLFRSEGHRHEKIRQYLQTVVEIRDIGRVYAVNCFFNASGKEDISAIRAIRGNSAQYPLLAESLLRASDSSASSRRFSQMMDDLGNQAYD